MNAGPVAGDNGTDLAYDEKGAFRPSKEDLMSRRFRPFGALVLAVLAVAAVAGFGAITSCNVTGGSTTGTGNLALLMTDAPTDDWTEVTVRFLSASLHRHGSGTWEDFWSANPSDQASGKVNLIDLSGVTDILSVDTIKEGTYDRLKLVLNTDPASMTLVTADEKVVRPEDITVIDPSGAGEIKVDLDPDLVVEAGKTNVLSIDFDLAHPLSIVNLDGKVVISLKVRHKRLPLNLNRIQFARTLGELTEPATANPDGTAAFNVTTLLGAQIEFDADANTIYTDVTSGKGVAGGFEGLRDLVGTGAALVASNMRSDGSLYARRVWYADSIDKLPKFTPEGLVRRIGDNWLSVQGRKTEALSTRNYHRSNWGAETVFVDAGTTWSFRGTDMGVTGTNGLRHLARGFRVEVVYVDENVSPKVAASINVQFAHAEGLVTEPTLDDFKLGWLWRTRTMLYSAVAEHEFGWWFYGLDAARSTDRQALIDSVRAAREAHLWAFAWAGLTWDAMRLQWVVESLVLAPMKLHELTRITDGYKAASGTMAVSTFNCWDWTTPEILTVKLDHATTDPIQTIVGSFLWRADTNAVTFTLPVQPDRWDDLLTPAIDKVRIWVHPVKEDDGAFRWHAYSVLAYQFIR